MDANSNGASDGGAVINLEQSPYLCQGGGGGDVQVQLGSLEPDLIETVQLSGIAWAYASAPTGGRLRILWGSTTVLDVAITSAGFDAVYFNPPLRFTNLNDEALLITLFGGGGGVNSTLNLLGLKTTQGS